MGADFFAGAEAGAELLAAGAVAAGAAAGADFAAGAGELAGAGAALGAGAEAAEGADPDALAFLLFFEDLPDEASDAGADAELASVEALAFFDFFVVFAVPEDVALEESAAALLSLDAAAFLDFFDFFVVDVELWSPLELLCVCVQAVMTPSDRQRHRQRHHFRSDVFVFTVFPQVLVEAEHIMSTCLSEIGLLH